MKNIINIFSKHLNRETISYVIFGILTTAVDYVASYLFFYEMGFSEITSNNIAWVLAVAFAYITNKIFVFEAKDTDIRILFREIISFAGARVLTLIITDIFLIFAKMIGLPFLFSKLIISVVVIILNYFLSKLFIFKNSNPEEGNNEQQINNMD